MLNCQIIYTFQFMNKPMVLTQSKDSHMLCNFLNIVSATATIHYIELTYALFCITTVLDAYFIRNTYATMPMTRDKESLRYLAFIFRVSSNATVLAFISTCKFHPDQAYLLYLHYQYCNRRAKPLKPQRVFLKAVYSRSII